MAILGKELDSKQYWADIASRYTGALDNAYHSHRMEVVRDLIPKGLLSPNKVVFDFGCGDAVLFPLFLSEGAQISGADVSAEMISKAGERLSEAGYDPELARVGGVESLQGLADASLDGLLSFNVLAYVTDEDEIEFYEEARRVVKPGGALVVTHSNELFDLFSLNTYTVDFFRKHFPYRKGIESLLAHPDVPADTPRYNVRENPLNYGRKLEEYGFSEARQTFINHHPAPPLLLEDKRDHLNTLEVPADERWKLQFTCSTFGSYSIRSA